MAVTRKSTPKYVVETLWGTVVYGPASKTDCKFMAGKLNVRGRKTSVIVVKAKASA